MAVLAVMGIYLYNGNDLNLLWNVRQAGGW